MQSKLKILLLAVLGLWVCTNCSTDSEKVLDDEIPIDSSCGVEGLLENAVDPDGNDIYIYEDGKLYINTNNTCEFQFQYFDPDFEVQNYTTNASGTF